MNKFLLCYEERYLFFLYYKFNFSPYSNFVNIYQGNVKEFPRSIGLGTIFRNILRENDKKKILILFITFYIYILLKAEAQRLMLLLSRCATSAATSFSFLKYNLSYNFEMVFTIFNPINPSPINVAHYLFIYFHHIIILFFSNFLYFFKHLLFF